MLIAITSSGQQPRQLNRDALCMALLQRRAKSRKEQLFFRRVLRKNFINPQGSEKNFQSTKNQKGNLEKRAKQTETSTLALGEHSVNSFFGAEQ
jgi:hypothetical protein